MLSDYEIQTMFLALAIGQQERIPIDLLRQRITELEVDQNSLPYSLEDLFETLITSLADCLNAEVAKSGSPLTERVSSQRIALLQSLAAPTQRKLDSLVMGFSW